MAHYRNLTVNGVDYEYNIGKEFVVTRQRGVKGNIVTLKEDIGFSYGERILITPGMIADFITSGRKGPLEKYFPHCTCTGVAKMLQALPFDAEIYGKLVLGVYCDECIRRNADDI